MKILQLFGLGNTAALHTVGLRRMGVDCDLLIANRAFITQYPKWTAEYPELEDHVYTWDKANMHDPQTLADLLKFVRKYDLISVHAPGANWAWLFDRPYTLWDGGAGNFILSKQFEPPEGTDKQLNHEAGRRGYKKAKHVFFNDANVIYTAWRKLSWTHDRYSYMQLPIDTDVFKPMDVKRVSDDFTVYLPTRQEYMWKGIDDILRGFAMFIQDVPTAQLLITRYGSDLPFTVWQVQNLGIQNHVKWVDLVPKKEFARLINAVDVVIDQVKIHSFGGVTAQTMACGKPVIVSIQQKWYHEQVGEGIPIVNARGADGVYQALLDVHQEKYRGLGEDARRYSERYHAFERVAERVLEVYENILA